MFNLYFTYNFYQTHNRFEGRWISTAKLFHQKNIHWTQDKNCNEITVSSCVKDGFMRKTRRLVNEQTAWTFVFIRFRKIPTHFNLFACLSFTQLTGLNFNCFTESARSTILVMRWFVRFSTDEAINHMLHFKCAVQIPNKFYYDFIKESHTHTMCIYDPSV